MTGRTVVTAYAVLGDGSTGRRVGPGLLADPFFVVLAPPAGAGIGPGSALRVGIAAPGGPAEVIDVATVHEIEDGLLGLELAHDADAPTTPVPAGGGSRTALVETLRAALTADAAPPDPTSPSPDPPGPTLPEPPFPPSPPPAPPGGGGPLPTGFLFCRLFPASFRCQ